jgi:hypothetical protein
VSKFIYSCCIIKVLDYISLFELLGIPQDRKISSGYYGKSTIIAVFGLGFVIFAQEFVGFEYFLDFFF